MKLPWNERVVSFQVNPESATIADIVRMAEELARARGRCMSPVNINWRKVWKEFEILTPSTWRGQKARIRNLVQKYGTVE